MTISTQTVVLTDVSLDSNFHYPVLQKNPNGGKRKSKRSLLRISETAAKMLIKIMKVIF